MRARVSGGENHQARPLPAGGWALLHSLVAEEMWEELSGRVLVSPGLGPAETRRAAVATNSPFLGVPGT